MDDLAYYLIVGGAFLFSYLVRGKLKRTYAKWSQIANRPRLPGAQVARNILDSNRLPNVQVEPGTGKLTDHYDPRSLTIRLAPENYQVPSVAAMAVSAHECGHALQDADDYRPLEIRTALGPVANTAARFGIPVAIGGSFLGIPLLVQIGALAYVGSILLHFLTLPVEFNASKRAIAQLNALGYTTPDEEAAAREVLKAAAMTYVAGVASSAGYLVYLGILGGRALLGRPKPPPPKIPVP